MKKRVLSLFLALPLCLTLTPTGALAEESLPGQTLRQLQCERRDGGVLHPEEGRNNAYHLDESELCQQ